MSKPYFITLNGHPVSVHTSIKDAWARLMVISPFDFGGIQAKHNRRPGATRIQRNPLTMGTVYSDFEVTPDPTRKPGSGR